MNFLRTRLFILLTGLLLCAGALAEESGTPYVEVHPRQPTQTVNKIEVMEFFWYGCPHCYAFESYLEKWLASKPADVEFVRVPGVLSSAWVPDARAFFAAQSLGVVDKIHRPLFDAIHKDRSLPQVATEEQLRDFVVSLGVDGAKFSQAFHSPETEIRLRQALVLAQNYKITGVPTLIINGKYETSATLAGSYEKLMQVVEDLVGRERKAMAAEGTGK